MCCTYRSQCVLCTAGNPLLSFTLGKSDRKTMNKTWFYDWPFCYPAFLVPYGGGCMGYVGLKPTALETLDHRASARFCCRKMPLFLVLDAPNPRLRLPFAQALQRVTKVTLGVPACRRASGLFWRLCYRKVTKATCPPLRFGDGLRPHPQPTRWGGSKPSPRPCGPSAGRACPLGSWAGFLWAAPPARNSRLSAVARDAVASPWWAFELPVARTHGSNHSWHLWGKAAGACLAWGMAELVGSIPRNRFCIV
jgi:hypothetical protein